MNKIEIEQYIEAIPVTTMSPEVFELIEQVKAKMAKWRTKWVQKRLDKIKEETEVDEFLAELNANMKPYKKGNWRPSY